MQDQSSGQQPPQQPSQYPPYPAPQYPPHPSQYTQPPYPPPYPPPLATYPSRPTLKPNQLQQWGGKAQKWGNILIGIGGTLILIWAMCAAGGAILGNHFASQSVTSPTAAAAQHGASPNTDAVLGGPLTAFKTTYDPMGIIAPATAGFSAQTHGEPFVVEINVSTGVQNGNDGNLHVVEVSLEHDGVAEDWVTKNASNLYAAFIPSDATLLSSNTCSADGPPCFTNVYFSSSLSRVLPPSVFQQLSPDDPAGTFTVWCSLMPDNGGYAGYCDIGLGNNQGGMD